MTESDEHQLAELQRENERLRQANAVLREINSELLESSARSHDPDELGAFLVRARGLRRQLKLAHGMFSSATIDEEMRADRQRQ